MTEQGGKAIGPILSLGIERRSGSPLSPELLQERARRLARLDDFGADVSLALQTFAGLFGELELTDYGRTSLASHAIQALVTRLRLTQALKQAPALFQVPLNDPLIVVGLPRTGTSYLHQLLSSLPDRRFLTFWEAREPIPDAEEDNRIRYYGHLANLVAQAAPRLTDQHPVDVNGPEECMFLLDPSLVSLSFIALDAPCRGYFDWVHDPRHEEPYRMYSQLLLYLQSSAPERRLVLKSPAHFSQLSALLRAVPGARLVHTHRDPIQVLGSLCSLHETMLGSSVIDFDRKHVGKEILSTMEFLLARNAAQREQMPAGACFDLRFDELTREPHASVERIHRHFGLGWSAEDESALRLELARGTPPQVGRHSYSLADYGLDAGEVAERLQGYRRRWGFA